MNYSRIIGEAPMRMMNPSVMVSRLDLAVLELMAAGIVFRRLPLGFLEYLGINRAKRWCGRPPRWEQLTRACLGPQARPGGLCSPRIPPQVLSWPIVCLLVQKKSPKSFAAFGLRLIRIFGEVKGSKNNNWQ